MAFPLTRAPISLHFVFCCNTRERESGRSWPHSEGAILIIDTVSVIATEVAHHHIIMGQFRALRLRKEGCQIPKWQIHTVELREGYLLVDEDRDRRLNRTVRQVRFVDANGRDL